MIGVANFLAHQLIATTDTHDSGTFMVCPDDGLCYTVTAQFMQVGKRTFTTWQQNDVSFSYFIGIISIKKMNTRIAFENIKISEVTEMSQENDSDIDFTLFRLYRFRGKSQGVFFFDINIAIVRYYSYHGYATKIFEHLDSRFEKTDISTEFIDKDTFNTFPFMRTKQHQRAIDTGKDSASINISYKDYICPGM